MGKEEFREAVNLLLDAQRKLPNFTDPPTEGFSSFADFEVSKLEDQFNGRWNREAAVLRYKDLEASLYIG